MRVGNVGATLLRGRRIGFVAEDIGQRRRLFGIGIGIILFFIRPTLRHYHTWHWPYYGTSTSTYSAAAAANCQLSFFYYE